MFERSTEPPAAPADVQALRFIRERLEAAENAFDAEPIVDVISDDVVLMVPNEPIQQGKGDCAAFLRRVLADQQAWFDRRITYVSDEISVRGDTSFDRGTFSFTVVARHDGRKSGATGKYLWLYTRTSSGDWKLARAIVSLDDPPEDTES
jgi:ketosteroid isomerase-like protein